MKAFWANVVMHCEQPPPSDFTDDRKSITVSSSRPARTLVDLVKWIDQHGIELSDIHLKRPTLEDVFIELTGKRLRE